MGFFKRDKDTKDVRREIEDLIDEGRPLHTKDGRKLYGKEAKAAVPSLAGDSFLDNLLGILKSCGR